MGSVGDQRGMGTGAPLVPEGSVPARGGMSHQGTATVTLTNTGTSTGPGPSKLLYFGGFFY